MNIIKSTSKIFTVNVINSVLGFIGIAYFARALGSAELGIFFLFQAVHGILSIPADFGINSAIKKRLSEGIDRSRMLGTAVLTKLVSIGTVSILVILIADYINSYLGANWGLYLIIALAINQFSQLFIAVLHGELRVGETAIIKLAKRVSWLVVGVLFISADYDAVSLVYAFIISDVVVIAWALYRIETPFGWPKITHVRSIYDYSRFSFISSIGGYAYSWVDVLIIGFF